MKKRINIFWVFIFLFSLFLHADEMGEDSNSTYYIKNTCSKKEKLAIVNLVKNAEEKLQKIYPDTIDYLKNNHLDFIILDLYYYYYNNLYDTPSFRFSTKKNKWEKESVNIQRALCQLKRLNSSQAELLWKLIPIYLKENPNAQEQIFYMILSVKPRLDLSWFLLQKAKKMNETPFKVRLLSVSCIMRANYIIYDAPKKEDASKLKKLKEDLTFELNNLSGDILPKTNKCLTLLYALMNGFIIDKKLILELYDKHDTSTQKSICQEIKNAYPGINVETNNDFHKLIEDYPSGKKYIKAEHVKER
jgi:hypothetical protein